MRVPEFVTGDVFEEAKKLLHQKKPELNLTRARLVQWEEGLCAQIMHIGSYDDEPATVGKLEAFIKSEGYEEDISDKRRHHEIYLNDPRKTASDKVKTILRHPIRKAR